MSDIRIEAGPTYVVGRNAAGRGIRLIVLGNAAIMILTFSLSIYSTSANPSRRRWRPPRIG